MLKATVSKVRAAIKDSGWIGYHIVILVLSAGIALSLPAVARNFLDYWSKVENEKTSLVSIEIAVAVFLIVFFNYVRRSLQDRSLAKVARGAGRDTAILHLTRYPVPSFLKITTHFQSFS